MARITFIFQGFKRVITTEKELADFKEFLCKGGIK